MKLWGGRFSGTVDSLAARMNSSLPFDQRLAEVDVIGSQAWAKALLKAGILESDELKKILEGLDAIMNEFIQGDFVFRDSDEDIHTAVERRLTEIIGSLAGKIHTGRSRNDQVATDFRLWMLERIPELDELLKDLQGALIGRAEKDMGTIMPGYTHLQQAQPILLSHWWLWFFWMIQRDRARLTNLKEEVAVLPLGCGALAGTAFPIDRLALTEDLGFLTPFPNSLDAVSDRDFVAVFLFWAALLGVHLGRLAETLIIYSTQEFGFIRLADEYSTGSSLMPQKKNPDLLELTRAQSGKMIGLLSGMLSILKGLPSTYDKDLQEDKPSVFEAYDRLSISLPVISGVISTLSVDSERMKTALDSRILATDLADYLVRKGVPFREAHSAVGQIVKEVELHRMDLSELPLERWQSVHPGFSDDVYKVFSVENSISRRNAWGGTAPEAVKKQIVIARQLLGK